jgi:hypothetical protein
MTKPSPLMLVFVWLTSFCFAMYVVTLAFAYEVNDLYEITIPLSAVGLAFVCFGGLVGALFGRSIAGAIWAIAIYFVFLLFFVPMVVGLASA